MTIGTRPSFSTSFSPFCPLLLLLLLLANFAWAQQQLLADDDGLLEVAANGTENGAQLGGAPHTLETLMNGGGRGNLTESGPGGMIHLHMKSTTSSSVPPPPQPPFGSSNELPVPIEGFLASEEVSASPTPAPEAISSTTAGQIRLPMPVQPEEPVVLPPPLGDCEDGHENCPFWAKNGFCQNQFYTQQTRAHFCPSSCGLC